MHPWATIWGAWAVLGQLCGFFWPPLGPSVEILKKDARPGGKYYSFLKALSGTFPLKSQVCVGICLHVVLWLFFNGFQDCLNLDPLAPVQSKHVFVYILGFALNKQ